MSVLIDIKIDNEGSEVVTAADMRAYMLFSDTSQDTLITSLIKSARIKLEKYANISIVSKEIVAWYTTDDDVIDLAYNPVASISEFYTHYRGEEKEYTVQEDYWVEGQVNKHIRLASTIDNNKYYRIVYTTSANGSELCKLAIKQQVAEWFVHRGDQLNGGDTMSLQLSKQAVNTIASISRNVNPFF